MGEIFRHIQTVLSKRRKMSFEIKCLHFVAVSFTFTTGVKRKQICSGDFPEH